MVSSLLTHGDTKGNYGWVVPVVATLCMRPRCAFWAQLSLLSALAICRYKPLCTLATVLSLLSVDGYIFDLHVYNGSYRLCLTTLQFISRTTIL